MAAVRVNDCDAVGAETRGDGSAFAFLQVFEIQVAHEAGGVNDCHGDSRFLGAMIHIIPEYTDADVTRGWVPPDGTVVPRKEDASGVLDTP